MFCVSTEEGCLCLFVFLKVVHNPIQWSPNQVAQERVGVVVAVIS